MADQLGCARITGTVGGDTSATDVQPETGESGEEDQMGVQVGQQAPDFTAPAYHNGDFTSVSLSDHAGKWVLLCFYPGDFTFV